MMLFGRILGSRLAGRLEAEHVVLASLLLALGSLLAYWLGSPPWQVAGILLAGLGIANLYPFNVGLALSSISGDAATASARLSLGAGGAILLSPIVLGAVADLTSLKLAQGLLAVLMLLAIANLVSLPRATPDTEPTPERGAKPTS